MALVVLMRGVNVGGHKTFRPAVLAKDLKRFDVVNIGAAGTFVIRKPVGRVQLRAEILRRMPFDAEVLICSGSDIVKLTNLDPFAGQATKHDVVQFVSMLAKQRPPLSPMPYSFPAQGAWGVRILAHHNRFVCGVYRREMKAISYLGQLDKLFGVPVTTRNWNTIQAIRRVLES